MNRQHRFDGVAVTDVTDVVLEGLRVVLDGFTVPVQRAARRDQKTGQHSKQARFAAAVRAAQDQSATFWHCKFQRSKNASARSSAGKVSSFERGHIGDVIPAEFNRSY